MQTPGYDPTDLNPDAAVAGHTHPPDPSTVQFIIGAERGTLVASPPNILWVRNHLGATITITEIHYEVRTAPAGQDLLAVTRRNFATVVHTGTIPAGSQRADYTGLNITWQADHAMDARPTQVGTTQPGADLVVTVVGTVTV